MTSKFVVLTYHRVRPQPDPLYPDMCHVQTFTSQLRILARYFNVLPLADALRLSAQNALPARSVCITFDDGYRDNIDVALPLLQEHGLPAMFFIATGYLNDGMMWNDQVIEAVRARADGRWDLSAINLGVRTLDGLASRRSVMHEAIAHLKHQSPSVRSQRAQWFADHSAIGHERIMMTDAEVRALHSAGMAIGGHTVSHPILTRLASSDARAELLDGKKTLESLLQDEVTLFAYPNGKAGVDYASPHTQLIHECGFDAAFTTMWGFIDAATPRSELPRVGLEMERGWRFGAKLYKCFYEALDPVSIMSPQAA